MVLRWLRVVSLQLAREYQGRRAISGRMCCLVGRPARPVVQRRTSDFARSDRPWGQCRCRLAWADAYFRAEGLHPHGVAVLEARYQEARFRGGQPGRGGLVPPLRRAESPIPELRGHYRVRDSKRGRHSSHRPPEPSRGSRIASMTLSHGVGPSPSSRCAAVESITKSERNWYWVSQSSRISGETRPSAYRAE